MDVVKMEMNTGITDEQFVLQQPEGAQMQVIGAAACYQPCGPRAQ